MRARGSSIVVGFGGDGATACREHDAPRDDEKERVFFDRIEYISRANNRIIILSQDRVGVLLYSGIVASE